MSPTKRIAKRDATLSSSTAAETSASSSSSSRSSSVPLTDTLLQKHSQSNVATSDVGSSSSKADTTTTTAATINTAAESTRSRKSNVDNCDSDLVVEVATPIPVPSIDTTVIQSAADTTISTNYNNHNINSYNNNHNHHHNNNAMALSSTVSTETVQKRRFLLFIKILFKTLDQSQDVTPEKRDTARRIVADCTRRNRLGDPNYTPLMAAVDIRLRRHLGEQCWRKAHIYMQHYINREAARSRLPPPVNTAAV